MSDGMIVGPRLAFASYNDGILCGNGNYVEFRESNSRNFKVSRKIKVFETTVICGICCLKDAGYLCYGDQKLALFDKNFEILATINLYSWISTVKVLEDGNIVVLTASSVLHKLNAKNLCVEEKIQLESYGILISGLIQGQSWDTLKVFVGVFDFIKRFCPTKSNKATKTLIGHTGMIFAFAYLNDILYSISDDRSLRAWDVENEKEIASVFGHSSRPFAIQVSTEVGILTAGADQFVCIWKLAKNTFELLQRITVDGGPIRSLHLLNSDLLVGSDTGSLFSFKIRAPDLGVETALSIQDRKICSFLKYSNYGFVILTRERELWIYKEGNYKMIDLAIFCKSQMLLKVPETTFFSICEVNVISIYDFNKDTRIFHLKLDFTICYKFWLGNLLFLTDDKQNCMIYEFVDNSLIYRSMFDVNAKQSFICSGCIYSRFYFLGTTRGMLIVISRTDYRVVRVFPHLHNKYLIADLKSKDDILYSTGKDGKINFWQIDEEINLNLIFSSGQIARPAKLLLDKNGNLDFITGLDGGKFVIINAHTFLTEFQVPYNSGNRRWSYDSDTHQLHFINHFKVYSIKMGGSDLKSLEGSWHQSEFTCLASFPLTQSKSLLFTGGNDTQISVSEYDMDSDNIELKFKYKQHAGSIHDMVICENFLITIASNGEFIIWEISADKDILLHFLHKEILRRDARLLSVDARLVDQNVFIAIVTSYGIISLFELTLSGTLIGSTEIEVAGISSITKICFVNDNYIATTSTNGHLISYEIEEAGRQIREKRQILVEQNMLTALSINSHIAFIGSVSGRISAVDLNLSNDILSQQAHASTVTDIRISKREDRLDVFSISLDRCVVLSEFDRHELRILKTIAHCIYDPSRIRILRTDEKSRCVISGYGMQSLLV